MPSKPATSDQEFAMIDTTQAMIAKLERMIAFAQMIVFVSIIVAIMSLTFVIMMVTQSYLGLITIALIIPALNAWARWTGALR